MNKIKIKDNYYYVHEAGVVYESDAVTPVPIFWEENPMIEYFKVQGKKVYTHSTVARAFLGEKGDRIIRHKDGDLLNNSIANLEYLDPEARGERVAKSHILIHKVTGKQVTITNWHKFKDKDKNKDLYRILKTYNHDGSVSFSAKGSPDTVCNHVDCNLDKTSLTSHCDFHRKEIRRIKYRWKIDYNSLTDSEASPDEVNTFLDEVTTMSSKFGINSFLQLPDPYTEYDVPTTATLTDISGEKNTEFTDLYGTLHAMSLEPDE